MATCAPASRRKWISVVMGRNPLVRVSDRLQALVLALVFAAAVAVVPLAISAGTAVNGAVIQLQAEEAQTRHAVTATVIDHSIATVDRLSLIETALARWRVGGVEHVGTIKVDQATSAGQNMSIWVDGLGGQVAPPTPASLAGVAAVVASAAIWIVVMAVVVGLAALACLGLNRRRSAGWDREWRSLVCDEAKERT
jgi:hypothetical protein